MSRPLAIDLFCGLGGWTEGLIAEGYDVIGFDIEQHVYGNQKYPAQMVVQDVLTLHGSQFRSADLIVASPPCQEFSYMAMPWSLAKAKAADYKSGKRDVKKLTALFDACFRIQREACTAAGAHVPMIVENVKGAQPWVGRARWAYGSYFLWGDVPALMPIQKYHQRLKVKAGEQWNINRPNFTGTRGWDEGIKKPGQNWSKFKETGEVSPHWNVSGFKIDGVEGYERDHPNAFGWKKPGTSSHSKARKAASAMIAKIPLPLSRHIAATFKPVNARAA